MEEKPPPASSSVTHLLVPAGRHKVPTVGAPVTRPDDAAVHGRVLAGASVQGEVRLWVREDRE